MQSLTVLLIPILIFAAGSCGTAVLIHAGQLLREKLLKISVPAIIIIAEGK